MAARDRPPGLRGRDPRDRAPPPRASAQYEQQRRQHLSHGDAAPAHALDTLVAGLEPDQRAAFVLTQIVGCSYAEAAAICDVPVGTIRSRVARARERLVAELDEADTG